MSSVRKCDVQRSEGCMDIFSELTEGWQTFSGTTMKTDDEGRRLPITVTMDACPNCAVLPEPVRKKQLAAAQHSDNLETRIKALEAEALGDKKEPAQA